VREEKEKRQGKSNPSNLNKKGGLKMAETYWERKLWEPDIETMPRKELREFQKKKLFRQLIYAYENAPLYKELYDKEKVDVYKIRTIEDFQKYVPPISKDDLRAYRERTGDIFGGVRCLPFTAKNFGSDFPFDGELLHSTGTTGKPTYYIETKEDLQNLANIRARNWWRAGIRPGDVAALGAGGVDIFNWHLEGLAYLNGYKKIGIALWYVWNQFNPAPDFDLMMQLKAQGIHLRWFHTLPALARWLMLKLEQEGKNLKRDYFPELKVVTQTGDISKGYLDYASELYGVPLINQSAVTETMWTMGACTYDWKEGDGARMSLHTPEDSHFIEIFPPGWDKAVKGAEFGEAVITNLFSRAMAYIRWRSEDLSGDIKYDPCPYCGYTHMQCRVMSRVTEAVDVMGKYITMGDVEDILYAHPECRPLPAQLIREEPQPQDKLRLRVCYKTELVKEPEQFRLKLADDFKRKLGVETSVDFITPEEVKALATKFERVIKEKRQS
jgi:phenylacetate-CoA ligase